LGDDTIRHDAEDLEMASEAVFEVRVPTPLLQLGIDEKEIQRRITEWLVLSLFSEGRISSGKAARLLSISRVEFLNLLRARGIAYINYTPDELAEEFAAVEQLKVELAK
jgi:predicted HTH domain antitoxin